MCGIRFNTITNMNTKIILSVIIISSVFCCATIKTSDNTSTNIYVDTYIAPRRVMDSVYYKKIKKFELIFVNDTICLFRNTFFCNDIAAEYRIIEQKCSYIKQDSMLIVSNLQSKYGNGWYIDIPVQESKKCDFLSESGHRLMLGVGTFYNLYGKVPNIKNDTLYYSKWEKDMIIFNKYDRETSESVYCEFRKVK